MTTTPATQAILPKGRASRDRLCAFIQSLPEDRPWRVEIAEHKLTRTAQQNAYLWGVCYKTMLQSLPGWRAEDVHEYMCGECFGWQPLEGLGVGRQRPVRGTSKLNKEEFSDFVAFVQQKAAEIGVFIPDPQ